MFIFGYTYQIPAIKPTGTGGGAPPSNWILASNAWNDSGEWVDSDVWND